MANHQYQATGLLQLTKITPVIEALFGVYSVQEHENVGEAYIKLASYESVASASALGDHINDTFLNSVLPYDSESDPVTVVIGAMAEKLGKTKEVEQVLSKHEKYMPQKHDEVSLSLLFDLAQAMDDGHGLSTLTYNGAWTCDKLRVDCFGGDGEFQGKHFSLISGSYLARNIGPTVNDAIDAGNLNAAAVEIAAYFNRFMHNVTDPAIRQAITYRVVPLVLNANQGQ